MSSMKRLLLGAAAALLAAGALANSPADACPSCDNCVVECQAQGFDDGVCSPRRCGGCYYFFIGG